MHLALAGLHPASARTWVICGSIWLRRSWHSTDTRPAEGAPSVERTYAGKGGHLRAYHPAQFQKRTQSAGQERTQSLRAIWGQSPNWGWQGGLAALLDVGQRYTMIPLCNILDRQSSVTESTSHRINNLRQKRPITPYPVRYLETREGELGTHECAE